MVKLTKHTRRINGKTIVVGKGDSLIGKTVGYKNKLYIIHSKHSKDRYNIKTKNGKSIIEGVSRFSMRIY